MKRLKQLDWINITFWVAVFILAFMFGCSITGCASAKSKHSYQSKSDSTSTVKESQESTVKIDSFAVRKSQTEEENTIIIDFRDSSGIEVTPVNKDDYFSIDKEGNIKTNRIPSKVIIKNQKQEQKVDSTAFHFDFMENHSKIEEVAVTNTVKISDKAKYSFNLLWLLWLLLIPVIVWLWRKYKDKIMAFYPF